MKHKKAPRTVPANGNAEVVFISKEKAGARFKLEFNCRRHGMILVLDAEKCSVELTVGRVKRTLTLDTLQSFITLPVNTKLKAGNGGIPLMIRTVKRVKALGHEVDAQRTVRNGSKPFMTALERQGELI